MTKIRQIICLTKPNLNFICFQEFSYFYGVIFNSLFALSNYVMNLDHGNSPSIFWAFWFNRREKIKSMKNRVISILNFIPEDTKVFLYWLVNQIKRKKYAWIEPISVWVIQYLNLNVSWRFSEPCCICSPWKNSWHFKKQGVSSNTIVSLYFYPVYTLKYSFRESSK